MSSSRASTPPARAGPRGAAGFAALLSPTWLVLGFFFLLPVLLVFLISFARADDAGGVQPVGGWEGLWRHVRSGDFLDNYRRSLEPIWLRVFGRAFRMAGLTTVLCALIGYPAAYYIAAVARRRWRGALLALVIVPFWTSFVIRTYAWVLILRGEGLLNALLKSWGLAGEPLDLLYNQTAVMIGLVYGELPFMILPLYASLERLDRSLLEAAADLGAGGWSAFRRVTLPLSAPGLAAGTLLVFIPALGQFVVSDMLGGAKSALLGNVVQSEFAATSGDKPFGSAVAFELVAAVLLTLFLYGLYARRRGGGELL